MNNKTKKLKLFASISLALGLTASLTSCDLLLTSETPSKTPPTPQEDGFVEGITYDDFQVHSLELGNDYAGDSTYIKAGDIDILIDAGSRKGSAATINKYLNQYVTDGKLEYVIATHAHQDHIAAFVGNKSGDTRDGVLYQFEVGTIIDFNYANTTSAIYKDYLTARDNLVKKGTKHFTAGDCFENKNGAQQTYQLTEEVSMQILYNKFYFETAEDENDYSVITLFTYKKGDVEEEFLLTGDLEKDGEEAFVEYYNRKDTPSLPEVTYYKAGHHGSKTSSNEALLEAIKPKIVSVCCCAGSTEYTEYIDNTFPTQDMIDRVAKYTSRVYITSLFDEKLDKAVSMNGNIIVSVSSENVAINATNNLTRLKDTKWFNEIIYVVDKNGEQVQVNKGTAGAYERPRRIMPKEWK